METVKKILLGLVCLLMLWPAIQKQWPIIKLEPLKGAFIPKSSINFNMENWFSGEFQKQYELALNDSIGLKSFFVRVHNQIDYSLYNKANAEDLVVGQKGFLHSPGQMNAHLGRDFIGANLIDSTLYKVKYLQAVLKKKNIDLMLIFAPGKPTFYEENFPSWFDTSNKSISNYTYYAQKCRELKIPHIDFNNYFLSLKDTSRFLLYPKSGIHWSVYGSAIAADSMIRYIEKTRNIDMPDIMYRGADITTELREPDYDCGDLMNLLWKIPSPEMAYPIIDYENNPKKVHPNVLIIADSYFWTINNSGIPANLLNDYSFWYYNKTAYTKVPPEMQVDQLNYKEEIEKKDVIILLATEFNMNRFGFGFIEKAYDIYKK